MHIIPAHGDPFDQLLEGESLVIGRSSAAELVLADRFLSRRHARLHKKDTDWFIEDLGSRNGTLLNGSRIEKPTRIKAGDELDVGYADGLIRAMGPRATLTSEGRKLPVVGRVSMDLITVDVTALPHEPETLQLIGPHQSIDTVAGFAGTIGYEILTNLGARLTRVWVA